MSEYAIRQAEPTLRDATALLRVEGQSLGDSPYRPPQALDLLRTPEHYAYLAFSGERAVGFCSCIELTGIEGRCLEVDMLGVLRESRERGVAAALVRCSLDAARRRGVKRARAVVATDNVASRKVLLKAGLQMPVAPCEMHVHKLHGYGAVPTVPSGWRWHRASGGQFQPLAGPGSAFSACGRGRHVHWLVDGTGTVAMAECVRIETMAYRGMWLERLWAASDRALRLMARLVVEEAKRLRLDEVGYLCPSSGPRDRARLALLRAEYCSVGSYHILTARLR